MIAVLCGGVGAARFLAALGSMVDPADTVGIVNTGDDTVLHGLVISPDLDTVTYTLAEAIDPDSRLGPGRRIVAGDGGVASIRGGATRGLLGGADMVQPRRSRTWRRTSTARPDSARAPRWPR